MGLIRLLEEKRISRHLSRSLCTAQKPPRCSLPEAQGRSLRQLGRGMLIALLILGSTQAWAHPQSEHALFGRVLSRFVSEGRVNYSALKTDPGELTAYLSSLSGLPESEFSTWPDSRRLAWLINLYNAQTLKLIVDHYPLKSIRNIGTIFQGPWDQPVVSLFGKKVTLADLEHRIIRKNYPDPRVHFALVCAAKGCPPLRGEPYEAERLEAQLEDQGRLFLSTESKNRWENGVLYLSPLFDWYKGDFVKRSGSVLAFVAPYFPEPVRAQWKDLTPPIRFTFYDWSLNGIDP